jgi:hypothetical protein
VRAVPNGVGHVLTLRRPPKVAPVVVALAAVVVGDEMI